VGVPWASLKASGNNPPAPGALRRENFQWARVLLADCPPNPWMRTDNPRQRFEIIANIMSSADILPLAAVGGGRAFGPEEVRGGQKSKSGP